MNQDADEQRKRVVDQFTRQAAPFREMSAHSDEGAFRIVLNASEVRSTDTVLDVACGPGLTSCKLAEVAKHVTGIDLTPAMIEQAQALQRVKGLTNLSWHIGDVKSLPFPGGTFSLVFTRYSFHHMDDPRAALDEMTRVAAPGGRVVVVDVYTTSAEQAKAYDHVERLRDPSHARALGLAEIAKLFQEAGLTDVTTDFYKLEVGLETLLSVSFPNPGDAEKIREIFAEDLGPNRLGVGARREADGEIHFDFPTVVVVGRKSGEG
jgi:ubiquinone/menaquinone biosynthesis C-methylase UbiE